MRVRDVGACADAGARPPMPATAVAAKPNDAAPPARKLRRVGLAGATGSAQHTQPRKSLRFICLIASSLAAARSGRHSLQLIVKSLTGHGLTARIASISTEIWFGRPAMPTAERAWR